MTHDPFESCSSSQATDKRQGLSAHIDARGQPISVLSYSCLHWNHATQAIGTQALKTNLVIAPRNSLFFFTYRGPGTLLPYQLSLMQARIRSQLTLRKCQPWLGARFLEANQIPNNSIPRQTQPSTHANVGHTATSLYLPTKTGWRNYIPPKSLTYLLFHVP